MKLTREQAIAEHRKMWYWIAEETIKRQEKVHPDEYLNTFFPNRTIMSHGFCCEYDRQFNNDCAHCPIEWDPDEKDSCCNNYNGSFYLGWAYTSNWQEAAKYARQIAELPERKV